MGISLRQDSGSHRRLAALAAGTGVLGVLWMLFFVRGR
jgi:hypothetical protein